MSIIEQIKAEIEKLKSNMDDRDSLALNQKAGYLFAIADILSFLSTLKSEKPVPNDPKEAAEKYADETYYAYPPEFLDFVKEEIRDAFNAGAKWDREQMMEKAVEGIARPDDCEIWVNLVGYGYKFNDGDKVRIIIVKED